MAQGGIIFIVKHAALGSDCAVLLPEEMKDVIRRGYYLDICSSDEPELRLRSIVANYGTGKYLTGGRFRDIRGLAFGVYMFEHYTFVRVPAELAEEARRMFGRREDLSYE